VLSVAYNNAMKSSGLINEAKDQHLELNPTTGQELETLVKELVAQPKEIVERMKILLGK
jgi:tripartite-type tricarboxylate transporter receptor subunit TctC